jgi:hypothetical protein
MRAIPRSVVACLAGLLQAAASAQGVAGAPANAASASLPHPLITCMVVRDRPVHETWFASPDGGAKQSTGVAAVARQVQCAGEGDVHPVMVGTGDVELVIGDGDYKDIVAYEEQHTRMFLYLNGVAMPRDAQLVAVEHLKGYTHLRYRIQQG